MKGDSHVSEREMKRSFAILAVILVMGCAKQPIQRVSHHLTIPCTNHYTILGKTRITTNLDARRSRSTPRPPDALLEYSTDGKTFNAFPMVLYSTASNTQGIREIMVSDTDLWIRVSTTNTTDLGRAVIMGFTHDNR